MKFKKVLAGSLAATLGLMILPVLAMTASAAPFADIAIVPDAISVIRAVDFDSGEYDWKDNSGSHDVREDEMVDNEFGSGVADDYGGNIGWTDHGTRVQWTVNVAAEGEYRFAAWCASDNGSNEGLSLYCGDELIGSIDYVEQEGWQEYALYNFGDIKMAAGTQVIHAKWGSVGGFNITAIIVTPMINGAPLWVPVEHKIAGSGKNIVRAVDFDAGAANYGKNANSDSKTIRPDEEVNTEIGESEFGGNIGWINAGEWVQYSVNIARDGMYKFDAWLATDSDSPGGIKIYIDGSEIGDSGMPNKNGWQAYELYGVGETPVLSGEHIVKVEFLGGNNFSALEISRTGNIEEPTEAPAAEENADEAEGEAAKDPAAADETEAASEDEKSGDNMTIIVIAIIAVVAVVVIVAIIGAIRSTGKNKGKEEDKEEDKDKDGDAEKKD